MEIERKRREVEREQKCVKLERLKICRKELRWKRILGRLVNGAQSIVGSVSLVRRMK